jgi:hypothetical protein
MGMGTLGGYALGEFLGLADGFGRDGDGGAVEVMAELELEPEFRRGVEGMAEQDGGFPGDPSGSVDDGGDAVGGNAEGCGEPIGADAEGARNSSLRISPGWISRSLSMASGCQCQGFGRRVYALRHA